MAHAVATNRRSTVTGRDGHERIEGHVVPWRALPSSVNVQHVKLVKASSTSSLDVKRWARADRRLDADDVRKPMAKRIGMRDTHIYRYISFPMTNPPLVAGHGGVDRWALIGTVTTSPACPRVCAIPSLWYTCMSPVCHLYFTHHVIMSPLSPFRHSWSLTWPSNSQVRHHVGTQYSTLRQHARLVKAGRGRSRPRARAYRPSCSSRTSRATSRNRTT